MKAISDRFSWRTYVLFMLALIAAMLLCICMGSVSIPLKDTLTAMWNTLWGLEVPQGISKNIILNVRLPRVINVALVGAALSLCGAAMQGLLRNPLADGSTLGVSSGASFGASFYFRFGTAVTVFGAMGSLGAALAGGFASMGLVYAITRARGGFSTSVMLLAGVIINFFFSSMVMFIQYCSNAQDSVQIMRWMMGSLLGIESIRLLDLAFVVALGCLFIRSISFELDLLMAGEEIASSRGVDVRATKTKAFVAASFIVATVVSIAGPIGFVGMMVPHICRMMLGWSHKVLLPASFVMGGCFLTLCDLLARTILAPAELPIGIITSMLGSPFFLWTLFKSNKSGAML
jgi:iron complex transport system permease protein